MNKIIIDNRVEGLSDLEALAYVEVVVRLGRVSNDDTQYGYHYGFEFNGKDIDVQSFLNKCSDRFLITEDFRPKLKDVYISCNNCKSSTCLGLCDCGDFHCIGDKHVSRLLCSNIIFQG